MTRFGYMLGFAVMAGISSTEQQVRRHTQDLVDSDDTMPTTVLIGNAVNRFAGDGTSWSSILDGLASMCFMTVGEELRAAPLPLLFEYLASGHTQTLNSEADLRTWVASAASGMDAQRAHDLLRGLEVSNILTTNYDYTIERALNSAPRRNPGPREFLFPPYVPTAPGSTEKRFNLFRSHTIGSTTVWHLHGEALAPRSIVLGHDQYVANLARLREYLLWSETGDAKSPYMRGRETDPPTELRSWADLFLRDNLHIVGSALDFNEVGIWWLLTLKARLRSERRAKKRGVEVGTTTYYPLSFDVAASNYPTRKLILIGLGVEVLDGFAEEGYDSFDEFRRIVQHIRRSAERERAPTRSSS